MSKIGGVGTAFPTVPAHFKHCMIDVKMTSLAPGDLVFRDEGVNTEELSQVLIQTLYTYIYIYIYIYIYMPALRSSINA